MAEEGDAVGGVQVLALDKVARLDEHAAGAAGGVEDDAVVRLDDVDDGLDEGRRCEELAVILRALHGELHEEVLVDAAEDVASGGAQSFAVEDTEQVFEHRGFELAVVLGKLVEQGFELALDGVHGGHEGGTKIRAGGQAHDLAVAGLLGEHEGAPLEEIGLVEGAAGHSASGLVLGNLAAGGVVAIGGVAEEDDAEHGHAVFGGGLVRVGAEVVGGLPKGCFQFFDVVHVDRGLVKRLV